MTKSPANRRTTGAGPGPAANALPASDDNPTVGIILCTQRDASVVRYSVLHENEQLFASRYKLVLPSEEELRQELERERAQLSNFSAFEDATS
jgi:hypothetical protein